MDNTVRHSRAPEGRFVRQVLIVFALAVLAKAIVELKVAIAALRGEIGELTQRERRPDN